MNERTKHVLREAVNGFLMLLALVSVCLMAAVIFTLPAKAANNCDWSNPGAAPYKGTLAAAIASYKDIPLSHRAALWVQATAIHPHGHVLITKQDVDTGRYSNLRNMHWGRSMCSGPVSRSGWADDHMEPAAIYCSGSYGIAIPAVCGNVAQVDCADPEPSQKTQQYRPLPHDPRLPERPNEVPEPSTLALIGAGLFAACITRKWRI